MLAILGLPADRYLTTHDAAERTVLVAVAQRANQILNEAAKRAQ